MPKNLFTGNNGPSKNPCFLIDWSCHLRFKEVIPREGEWVSNELSILLLVTVFIMVRQFQIPFSCKVFANLALFLQGYLAPAINIHVRFLQDLGKLT